MTDILPPAGWPNVRQLETNEFATGGANGNMNEQAKSLAARSELLKQYAALPYKSKTGGYALNERVQLATGDIVRSIIPSNVNNPNENMTGWVKTNAASQIFDASGKTQQQVNDIALKEFNVLEYGADPTGATSSYLAFKSCSEALSASGKGRFVVPYGEYVIGYQESPSAGEDFRLVGRYPINLQELGAVVIDLQGCTLKNPDGMYYGNFNADMSASGSEAQWYSGYRCSTGALFNIVGNESVEFVGSAKLDGGLDNYIIGGVYGDFGIQIESYGIKLIANKSFTNNAVIETTNFGNDGVYVGDRYRNKAGIIVESTDNTELAKHIVKNIRSTYNARQGISFCGGSGVIEDCYIEGIGKTRLTTTLPRAGIDVEQESGVLRDLTINRTTIFDCAGISLVTTSGASKRLKIKDSRFIGISNYSNYAFCGEYRGSWFVGKIGTGGTLATLKERGDYPTYIGCTFSSRPIDARGLTPYGGGLLVEPIFQNILEKAYFEDCDFYTTGGWCFLEGLTEFTFKNCRFYIAPETTRSGVLTQFGRSNLIDCDFIDLRESPVDDIIISRSNQFAGVWENVKITSTTEKLKFSWVTANDNFGVLSNNKPSQIDPSLRLVRDGLQVVVDSNLSRVSSIFLRSSIPSSPLSYGNPYVIGDKLLNGLPTSGSWVDAVCTTSGYSCTTTWVSTTVYPINSYVYAGSKVYKATVAGTSGTVPPTHTSGTATDGTVTWEYIGTKAVFRLSGEKAVTVANSTDTTNVAVQFNALLTSLRNAGYIQ